MAAGQGRARGARPPGAKARDKGTRGGRPEPQPGPARTRPAGKAPDRTRPGAGARRPGPNEAAAAPVPAADEPRIAPLWLQLTTWVLAAGGLGVSIYLTIAHFNQQISLACPETGHVNCEKVTTSPESYFAGIPVAVLGLAFYIFMIAATSPWAWRATATATSSRVWRAVAPALGWVRLGSVVVGMAFVLYLVYTELYTLNLTICLWCTSVHVITFGLFGLIVFAASAGYGITRTPPPR